MVDKQCLTMSLYKELLYHCNSHTKISQSYIAIRTLRFHSYT
jgi:hypothetical protein